MGDELKNRIVRPTLRCLLEDLGRDAGPDELQAALGSALRDMADDDHYLFPCPLTAVEHPVVERANLIAGDDAADRERINVITDRHVVKVKTSDRRGALWQDDAGRWWLLAAGHRKDDGPGDFYRDLDRFRGSSSDPIAPTDVDRRYLAFESAYAAECAAEHEAHRGLIEAMFEAARRPSERCEVLVFGAVVSVRVEPDEGGLAVLELSWEFDRFDEAGRFPYDVLAMVPGHESIDLWDYVPPRAESDSPHTWFTLVPQAWIDDLATSAEIDDLIGDDWAPSNPSTDGSEHFSHFAQRAVVTVAYIEGIEILGLCGASVVAHRDYEQFPTCPRCVEALDLLRRMRGGSES